MTNPTPRRYKLKKSGEKNAITSSTRSQGKEPEMTVEECIESLELKIVLPEDNDNFMDNLIGHAENKDFIVQIASFFTEEEEDEAEGNILLEHPNLLFVGPQGVGKTTCAFAVAKAMEVPIVVIDTQNLVTAMPDHRQFSRVFGGLSKVLDAVGGAVVLFKEVQYINSYSQNNNIAVSTMICSLIRNYPECLFIATTSQEEVAFQRFFLEEGGFEIPVTFELPNHAEREALIRRFISIYPHEDDIDYDKLARDFIDYSGGDIQKTLKAAWYQCRIKKIPKLNYKMINEAIWAEQYGREVKKMQEKEIRLTAYHEAGHVIAGFYGCPNYQVSKVEVLRRQESLGLTMGENDEEKESYTIEDLEGRIILNFGGKVAEELTFHTSTSGVVQDLANATVIAVQMIKRCGMDPDFGPVYVDDEVFPSNILDDDADVRVQNLLKRLYQKAITIMLEHKDKLILIAEALCKKEVLYKEEVLALLNQ
jgi:cell division protease FtsH